MLNRFLLSLACLVAASPSFAEIKMPRIFSDNMVLQCSMPVKIWGWSEPRANIDVVFGGQKVSTLASSKGEWALLLPPMPPDKNPKDMAIFENGAGEKNIKNVLVGEVWILSGQSNMEFHLASSSEAKEAKARADYPQMRYFSMKTSFVTDTPQNDMPEDSRWEICTPKNAGKFHAVGFYFGEALMKDLDVPVGLIGTALGATHVACWVPQDEFEGHKGLELEWAEHIELLKTYDYAKAVADYEKRMADYAAAMKKHKEEGAPKPKPLNWRKKVRPLSFSALLPAFYPSGNFNSKIAPIAGLSARGVLWYQGEGDALPKLAPHYYDSLSHMIDVWRQRWNNPKLPFILVQIASFGSPADWKWNEIQFAHTRAWRELDNVMMATSTDIGEEKDIHPRDKTTLGMRLEKIALAEIYGKLPSGSANPPYFKSADFRGDKAVMDLETFSQEMSFKDPLSGFEIFSGGKWRPANAKLLPISKSGKGKKGEKSKILKVELSSEDSSEIEAVRYLWKPWCLEDISIRGADGQPASLAHFEK